MFLDLVTLERHEDQWAYLSTLGRMTPAELKRADRAGKVAVAAEVTRLNSASSTKTRPPASPVLTVRLGAGIRLEQAELTPGLAATLRHAASIHNPEFYERRMRASTYNIPRFLHCFQETIDGGLVLPRGMLDTVTSLAAQAGSRLNVTDQRSPGTRQGFTCTAASAPTYASRQPSDPHRQRLPHATMVVLPHSSALEVAPWYELPQEISDAPTQDPISTTAVCRTPRPAPAHSSAWPIALAQFSNRNGRAVCSRSSRSTRLSRGARGWRSR